MKYARFPFFARSNRAPKKNRRPALRLELLEDRCLLSITFDSAFANYSNGAPPPITSTNGRPVGVNGFWTFQVASPSSVDDAFATLAQPIQTDWGDGIVDPFGFVNNIIRPPAIPGPAIIATDTHIYRHVGLFTATMTVHDSTSGETGIGAQTIAVEADSGPDALIFATQPTGGGQGDPLPGPVTVDVVFNDGTNAIDHGFSGQVFLYLTNPQGATLSGGVVTISNGSGVATFPNLSIDKPGSGYVLRAFTATAAGVNSNPFDIGHTLSFKQQPPNGGAGDPLDTKVEIDDTTGKPDATFTGSVMLQLRDQNGKFVTNGGSLVDDKGNPIPNITQQAPSTGFTGVLDFNDVRVNKTGTYTLIASIPGELGFTTEQISNPFTLSPHTVSVVLPTKFGGSPGEVLPDFQVQAIGANGQVDPNFNGSATLSLNTVPMTPGGGGKLTLTTVNIVNGQGAAHLAGVTLGGTYTITATLDTDGGAGTSGQFVVQRSLKVLQMAPAKGTANEPLGAPILDNGAPTSPIKVEVLAGDPADNIVDTQFLGSIQITDAAGNVVNGTAAVGQNAFGKPIPGVAVFNAVNIYQVSAGNQLTAGIVEDNVTPSVSVGTIDVVPHTFLFNVAPPDPSTNDLPGAPNAGRTGEVLLGYPIGEPPSAANLQPLQVSAFDATERFDPSFNGLLILAINPDHNPGNSLAPTGGIAKAVKGVATFDQLEIDKPGEGYQLTTTGDGDTHNIGKLFNVIGDRVEFDSESGRRAGVFEQLNPPVVVDILKPSGIVDTNFNGPVTISIETDSPLHGAFTPMTTTRVNAVNGVATFSVGFTESSSNGVITQPYTLTASLNDGTQTRNFSSPQIDIEPDTLQFTTPFPAFGQPNDPLTPTVEVRAFLHGLSDNVDTSFNKVVTLQAGPGSPPGFPTGTGGDGTTLSVAAVNGVAAFPMLSILQPGNGFTIEASDPTDSLTNTTDRDREAFGPNAIDILPHILEVVAPSGGPAQQALPPVTVQIFTNPGNHADLAYTGAVQFALGDANGNPILGTPTGPKLSGGVAMAGGAQAVFSNLTITQPGTYTLIAFITGEGPRVASSAFTVTNTVGNAGQDVSVNGTPGMINNINVGAGGGGDGSVTYTLNGGPPVNDNNVHTFTYNGTGADTATVNVPPGGTLANGGIVVNGANTLNVNANGQPVVTTPGSVNTVDPQAILYANVRTININGAVAVDALPGPDTADRAAALAGLTGNAAFVEKLYLDDLGRVGDTTKPIDAGYWIAALNSGALSRAGVVQGVESSFEAQDHLVRTWYQAYLGRQAQAGEETGWVGLLKFGLTEEQVLSGILGSAEFYNRAQTLTGAATGSQSYVQALYQLLLNRTPPAADATGWVNALPALGRGGAALAFLTGQEFRTDQFEGYYNALLNRPDDPAGLNGWVFSNLDVRNVRINFETSPEFFGNG